MKPTILLVVASIHLGGSYYNQTALSSVLSKFEAQLTIPRRKDSEQTAPVTNTAPAAPAPASAPAPAAPTPAAPAPAAPAAPTTVASVDESSTEFQVIAGNSTVGEPTDSTLLSANVASVDESSTESQVIADNFTVDEQADSTLLSVNVNPVDKTSTATQVIADNFTVNKPAESTLLSVNVTPVDQSSTAVILVDKESSTKSTTTAVTRSTTKVSTSSARVPQERAGLPQQREVGQNEDTAPRAVHVVANSGTSHVWTFKEASLVAHLSQVLWLCALTGISTYFIGAQALLWRAVENLRRARAQAVHV